MKTEQEAILLRIFVGESDKINHVPIYERIVKEAREANLAGATVYKGIMGFGENSRIHSSKILRLSEDMPLVIEIVDEKLKVDSFITHVEKMFEESNSSGLITSEKVNIIKYSKTGKQ